MSRKVDIPRSMPYRLLDEIMVAAGEEPASRLVEFSGADPVFPTPFRIGEMGAATIAAAALQAARLWELRSGRLQRIRVSVDAAAAAMRSSRYLRLDTPEGRSSPGARSGGAAVGIYPTRDGRWIYFQRLFPHHRARLFSVLGCADEEEAITRSAARWDASELEQAVVASGASAGMIRTSDEWSAHPQAQTLAQLPLFEVTRIAGSPPEPLPAGDRPLSGIRVLDLTRVLAGPTCGRTLAEHGADVLRVGTLQLPDDEGMMRDTGHGKRSTALDLTTADGVRRLESLIRDADVFSQGYRPGSLAARGFSFERVASLRPGIVYVTISAFGHEGPWRGRRGFDSVVQTVSGMADENGMDGKPRLLPANPLDYATGYLAAFGAMVALARRAQTGGSYLVRLSLAQTGRWLATLPRVDRELTLACPKELPAARLNELMMSSDTPFGRLRYLAPAAQLTETPARWDRPTVPLDNDLAAWL